MNNQPRLLQTYLLDGTLEGVRIVDCESSIKAVVVPRLRLGDIRQRAESSLPALYFLISSDTNKAYVGESENFYARVKNHDQRKEWWDIAVAIVSNTNELEKGDVKYLESLAIERARGGSFNVVNKTVPLRNNVHEFKLHKLQKILDDTQLILISLGYDVLSAPSEKPERAWFCRSKKTNAKAVFRGDQFVILADSTIDGSYTEAWASAHPASAEERTRILQDQPMLPNEGNVYVLGENISFRSPNTAGGFAVGRSANAWTLWKDQDGNTMDALMRKVAK